MQNNYEEKLKEIIVKNSKIDISAEKITNETNLIVDLAFDSIQLLTLITEIEETFNVLIDPDSLKIEIISVYEGIKQCLEKHIN